MWFSKAKTDIFVQEKSKGGLWVVLAKFSSTNGIFNKMGLFSENLAIILENGIRSHLCENVLYATWALFYATKET